MNKILVVGGAGYVGGYLTDLLQERGYDVTVFDNLLYETRFLKKVKFINGDVRDKNLLKETIDDYDCIVWLAAIVGDGACTLNERETKEVNEEATKWLVDNYNKKIVFTSTCSVYGKNDNLIDEEADPEPLSVYAETKLAAEQYIVHNHDDYLIFRLGTLYGLGDLFSRIRLDLVANILACKAAMGEKLSVFGGEQWRPLVHVKDVGRAILFGLEKEVKGLYNLSDGNYKIFEMAEAIQKVVKEAKIEYSELQFEDRRNYKVKNDKIFSTGWKPSHNLEEGIREMVQAVQENRIVDIKNPIYSNENFLSSKLKWRG